MEIRIQGDVINIYRDDRDEPIYFFLKSNLGEILESGGSNLSGWIMQLIKKSWINTKILYDLGVIIQQELPQNEIDWYETFFIVEKKEYLDHVKATKKLNTKKPKSAFETLTESIYTGVEENNEFVNGEVKKIVEMNLKNYGISYK